MSNINNFDELSQVLHLENLQDLLRFLPKQESSNGDEAAFQSDDLFALQNHMFSSFVESNTLPVEPSWRSGNIDSIIDANAMWQQSDMQATTSVTSQSLDMPPQSEAAEHSLAGQLYAAYASPSTSYSSDEFQRGTPPLISNRESKVQNPPLNLGSYVCGICSDRATGKHYGAVSCDGCKGFFRRSVRKDQEYFCRFSRVCIVTKEKRNHCRYCRLKKCFKAGMKQEAVQNERDKIVYRRPSQKQNQETRNEHIISYLLQFEEQSRTSEATNAAEQVASVLDVCNSMKDGLLRFVEWTKKLPECFNVSPQDQEILQKTRGAEHLILGVARRSFNRDNSLLLRNRRVILKDISNADFVQNASEFQRMVQERITIISNRIFRELIEPWKSMKMDDVEFTCLKTIVFFNPNVKGLVETERVETLRNEVQIHLEKYISDRQYERAGRLGKLLLTLPSLQSISKAMSDEIMQAELLYGLKMDEMLQEML